MTTSPFTSLRPSLLFRPLLRPLLHLAGLTIGVLPVFALAIAITANAQQNTGSTAKTPDRLAVTTAQTGVVDPIPAREQAPPIKQAPSDTDPKAPVSSPDVSATGSDEDDQLQHCLSDSIVALQARIDKLEQQLTRTEQAAKTARDEADKLRRDAEKQQNAAEEQIAALDNDLQAARKKLADNEKSSEQQLAAAHAKAQELGTKLSAESKANARLEAELAQATKARNAAAKQHDEAMQALREQLAAAEQAQPTTELAEKANASQDASQDSGQDR